MFKVCFLIVFLTSTTLKIHQIYWYFGTPFFIYFYFLVKLPFLKTFITSGLDPDFLEKKKPRVRILSPVCLTTRDVKLNWLSSMPSAYICIFVCSSTRVLLPSCLAEPSLLLLLRSLQSTSLKSLSNEVYQVTIVASG